MKLYIVRHGQTDHNKNNLRQGSIDTLLNEEGKKQSLLLQEEFKNKHVDVVLSSPLKRAHETASLVMPNHSIILDNRLSERSLGIYEGTLSSSSSFEHYGHYHLNSDEHGVERIKDLYTRVDSLFNELKEKYHDKTIMLVTHGAVYNVIYYYIHGIPEDGILTFQYLKNGEYIEYEI
jgi:broad specificity phosphatase PhoE